MPACMKLPTGHFRHMSMNAVALRVEVIEHAMRLGAPEATLLALATSEPHSAHAFATLGRLMDQPGIELASSSPLVVWCAGGTLDPAWRTQCSQQTGLWRELCDLRLMFGELEALDPYAELQALRDHADISITE